MKCLLHNMKEARDRPHHIYYGNGTRDISDTYGLIAWLCDCHLPVVHNEKKVYIYKIMFRYGFNDKEIIEINRIMNKCYKRMTDSEKEVLIQAGLKIKEYIAKHNDL